MTVPQHPQHTSPVARRRGAALENTLLDAVWTQLQNVSYAKPTMNRVAERPRRAAPGFAAGRARVVLVGGKSWVA